MPFYYDPNLTDDQNKGTVRTADPTLNGAGSGGGGGTGAASSAPPANQSTGSHYQNLDNYLQTNQGQTFGQQVLDKVGDSVNQAQQSQAQGASQFKDQVAGASRVPTQQQVTDAIDHPDASKASDFQGWMNQSYQGPNNFSDDQNAWNTYWSGTEKAQQEAKALGSEAGRFSLLDTYFGKPQYNFGEKSLDNLLVQQSGLGRQKQDLQNQASVLNSQGQQQAQDLQEIASRAPGQVNDSRKFVNDSFGAAQKQAQDAIATNLKDANTQRKKDQDAIYQGLLQNNLTGNQFDQIGVGQGQKTYDKNAVDYYHANNPLTAEQATTPEQRARLEALYQLSGNTQDYLGAQQDPTSAFTFDNNKLSNDAAGKEARLNTLKKDLADPNQLPSTYLNGNTTLTYKGAPTSPAETAARFRDVLSQAPSSYPFRTEMQHYIDMFDEYTKLNTGKSLGTAPSTVQLKPRGPTPFVRMPS